MVGSGRVAHVKSSGWKEAVAFFLTIVALRGGWNLITERESALYILGWSALPAVFFYVVRREDWFD
jgi:hypothetical protein